MARIRSRAWTVLPRTPIHLQGRHIGRNRIRLRRTRPRAARGMTRVRNTSSRVQTTSTMPTGSAIHRIHRSLPVGPSDPGILRRSGFEGTRGRPVVDRSDEVIDEGVEQGRAGGSDS